MKYGKMLKIMNGKYQVSNYGRVKSLNYNKTKQEKILNYGYTTKGYTYVNLCKNGKTHPITIHKLVATTFIDNPNNYTEINHKDENPKNNNVNNLEWCSHIYNMNYGTGLKRRSENNKIPIIQYDLQENFIKKWKSAIDIQNEISINQASIIKCCKNKLKTAGGYKWRYAINNTDIIQNLQKELDKEKEKNKELERQILSKSGIYEIGIDFDNDYISKDKIKELLHSYSVDDKRFTKYLKELLEE